MYASSLKSPPLEESPVNHTNNCYDTTDGFNIEQPFLVRLLAAFEEPASDQKYELDESKYTNEPREKQTTKGLKHKSSRGLIVWAKEQEIKI